MLASCKITAIRLKRLLPFLEPRSTKYHQLESLSLYRTCVRSLDQFQPESKALPHLGDSKCERNKAAGPRERERDREREERERERQERERERERESISLVHCDDPPEGFNVLAALRLVVIS